MDLFRTDGTLKARGKLLADLQEEAYQTWKQDNDETIMQDVLIGKDEDGNDIIEQRQVNVFIQTITENDLDEYLNNNTEYVAYMKNYRLNTLTVEVNGKVFDGNEKARLNMLSALQASSVVNIESANWKLADNTVVEVTITELKEALTKAIQEVGNIIL